MPIFIVKTGLIISIILKHILNHNLHSHPPPPHPEISNVLDHIIKLPKIGLQPFPLAGKGNYSPRGHKYL